MPDQFSRTAMLIGRDNVEKLKNRRVAVFGTGGVGGHCAEALCRAGIGALDLFDGDIVDITNINRQIIATHKTIGRGKAEVMRERLLDINPHASVEARKLFYLPETAGEVDLSIYDYIVDAMDTITAKIELVCRAAALGTAVISSMGAANKLDPTAFSVADIYETSVCPVARVMRRELRKKGIGALKVVYSKEQPLAPITDVAGASGGDTNPDACVAGAFGDTYEETDVTGATGDASQEIVGAARRGRIPASNSFVPAVAGLIMAGEVVKDLIR